MREFIDSILDFISASSLTNDEYATFTISTQAYTFALYTQILAVLDGRESASRTRDRLKFFFWAANVDIDTPEAAKSNILVGSALWN